MFGESAATDSGDPTTDLKGSTQSSYLRIKHLQRAEGKEQIDALFKELGIHYLERTVFSPKRADFAKTTREDYAENSKPCKVSAETFEEFSHLIRQGYRPPVYIKWISKTVGYGTFAAKDLPTGTLIGEYTGIVMPKSAVKNRTWSWKYPIKGQFKEPFPQANSLDGGEYGNELRFINHGDNRNTSPVFIHDGTTWVNCYFARKSIAKDQELLINYGKRYWKTRTKVDL